MKFKLTVVLLLSVSLIFPHLVFSESPADPLEQKIKELQTKVESLQNQAKTLANQIILIDSQINITQLKITRTRDQIIKLIDKIDRLEVSLDHFALILENRISKTYEQSYFNPLSVLLSSDRLSGFILRFKYLRLIQAHDRKILSQIVQTQTNYEDQKAEEEKLKLELESNKLLLSRQIKQKETLLEVTKNDEKKYQALLSAAKAEQEAIRAAMRTISLKNGSPVSQGDTIALIGNTGAPGCSSGAHLHFEVEKNKSTQDPSLFLKSVSVTWDNQPDGPFSFTGSWDFPIGSPRITQGYGMTSYARDGRYGGGPHTGIDMVSDDIAIRAPKSGTLYRGSANCKGSTMNYVALDHGDGVFSWYWHVR